MNGAFARTLAYASGFRFVETGAKTVPVKIKGKRGGSTAIQPMKLRTEEIPRRGYSYA